MARNLSIFEISGRFALLSEINFKLGYLYIYKGVEVFGFVTLKLLNYKFHFNMRHTNLKLSIRRFARNNKKLK